MKADLDRFEPRRFLRSGHAMTVFSWGSSRQFPKLPPPTPRFFDVAGDTRVMAHCHWHPEPGKRTTLVALHGLNGSSGAHYMRGMASKAFDRGMNVVLLNQRNCGNTEHLSAGLFNSGLTADPRAVIEELIAVDGLERIAVAGYSLGGNLALKLAGEYADAAPKAVVAAAAVSPIMEISGCVRALEKPGNVAYQWNFVRGLKRLMRRKALAWPGAFDLSRLKGLWTVRAFDEAYTAPYFGYAGAEDYYHRASAMRVIDRIALPTLIITAEDDPFVPAEPFHDRRVTENPWITLQLSPHGGHCGFVGPRTDTADGYWAEDRIMRFVEAAEAAPARTSAGEQAQAPSPALRA